MHSCANIILYLYKNNPVPSSRINYQQNLKISSYSGSNSRDLKPKQQISKFQCHLFFYTLFFYTLPHNHIVVWQALQPTEREPDKKNFLIRYFLEPPQDSCTVYGTLTTKYPFLDFVVFFRILCSPGRIVLLYIFMLILIMHKK